MDHNRVVETQAVERYLLGEMKPEERETFEEHFFECEECAAEVRAGARFRANAREVLPEFPKQKAQARESGFWAWLRPPALAWATAALALVVVYQAAIQVPSLRSQLRAQAIPALALRAAARGADDLPKVPASARLFTVYFDVLGSAASSYHCTLTNGKGNTVDQFAVNSKPNEALTLLLDRSRLAPGRYTLTLKSESDAAALPIPYMFVVE